MVLLGWYIEGRREILVGGGPSDAGATRTGPREARDTNETSKREKRETREGGKVQLSNAVA